MYNKTFSPYRIVGTMLKNWHFSPVDAVADGGTTPTDANPITKAAEKYAESRISNVTGYNRMAKHISKADKGRKWEDVIIKLVDSVAYSRNSAPQAPTPPDIVSMTYKKNTSRQFKTSLYEKDVDAIVRGDMEAQELNDKIVGALAESRDKEDYEGLQEMLDSLRVARYPHGEDAGLATDIANFNAITGEPNAVTITDDVGAFIENIITAVEDMRNAKSGYNGTVSMNGPQYDKYTGFEQRAENITIYVSPRIRAKILIYLKSTRSMDFADLGADLVAINNSVTIEDGDGTNTIYDIACVVDDRAIGLVHYGNEVRAGAFNPDAWATPFVLNEVGNFYYSTYFSSSFHMLKRS